MQNYSPASAAYLPGIKLHRRSRAPTRVRRGAPDRFTFITSNIDHAQRAPLYLCSVARIVARPVTEIVSRFDQRAASTSDFAAAFSGTPCFIRSSVSGVPLDAFPLVSRESERSILLLILELQLPTDSLIMIFFYNDITFVLYFIDRKILTL